MCTEVDNWGFAIDESNDEMIIGASRDVHHCNSVIEREAVGGMPIQRHCRESALTVLAIQFCQVWGHDTFAEVFLPGEAFNDLTASQIICVLMEINGSCIDLEFLINELVLDLR